MGLGMRRGGRRAGARRARPARRRQQNRARRNRRQRRWGNRHGGGVLFHRGRRLGHFNFGGRGHHGHGFRGRFAGGLMFYRRGGGRGVGASVGSSTGAGVSGTDEPQQCTPMAQLIVAMPVAAAMLIAGVILFALDVSWVMGITFMGFGGGLLILCLLGCFFQCFDEVDDKDATSQVDVEAQSRCQSELSVSSTVTHQPPAVPMSTLQSTYNQSQQGAWTTSAAPPAAPGHFPPHPQTQMQAVDPMAAHYHAQNPVLPYPPQGQAQDPMTSHYQAQNPVAAYPPQAQQHEPPASSYHPQAQTQVPMASPYPQVPYQPQAQINNDRTQPPETEMVPPPSYEDVMAPPST